MFSYFMGRNITGLDPPVPLMKLQRDGPGIIMLRSVPWASRGPLYQDPNVFKGDYLKNRDLAWPKELVNWPISARSFPTTHISLSAVPWSTFSLWFVAIVSFEKCSNPGAVSPGKMVDWAISLWKEVSDDIVACKAGLDHGSQKRLYSSLDCDQFWDGFIRHEIDEQMMIISYFG